MNGGRDPLDEPLPPTGAPLLHSCRGTAAEKAALISSDLDHSTTGGPRGCRGAVG